MKWNPGSSGSREGGACVKKVKLNLTIGGSWSNASEEAQRLVEESRNDVEKVRKAAEQVLEESVADTADMAITAAVKLKLVEDADVNAARIHVNTHRGVVRLTGEVGIRPRCSVRLASRICEVCS